MLLLLLSCVSFPSHTVANNLTNQFQFLYYAFYDIAYSPLLVAYTVEILPFSIRAKGFAVMVRVFLNSAESVTDLRLATELNCQRRADLQSVRQPGRA